jgi:hypothetical protein
MIQFKDFYPKEVTPAGFLSRAQYESLYQAVDAANAWVNESNAKLLNIETVVLPNIHRPHEEGTTDTSLWQGGESSATWHQFIRVWYSS